MAPVILELKRLGNFSPCVVATAQHREMLDQVLREFSIEVDHDLDLMTNGQTLSQLTSRCISALDKVVTTEKPHIIIAQGDTTTTFVAALAAFYNRIPFAHVEAGLRTFDIMDPFPEEFNRQVVSKITRLHFAPTDSAARYLFNEGIPKDSIIVTGNTVIDALMSITTTHDRQRLDRPARKMLLTIHRRENFGEPLRRIGKALHMLLASEPELTINWPVHPNPNVKEFAWTEFGNHPRVHLKEPLGYAKFVSAMIEADFIVSDSGGVQEEAPALARPVLVLRKETERPEAVVAGAAQLVGTETESIVKSVSELMHNTALYKEMAKGISPYGDGKAASRIAAKIAEFCNSNM
ncbi:UDP-N-acetylglucosamine 2-epimerase (non-hydrolysing) [Methylobacterium sp. 174MFSha1.1]|nr:UDP-N-acetylglucosamine 2-epimerase (non-hydrolysing) [Methylobacterium sp. 174MFSha1.1]